MQNTQPTILLLDDFPDACEAVAIWLEMDGWSPIATTSPEEALSILAHESVAAIVMETHLQAGDAIAVAEAARDSKFGRPLMIALSTRGRARGDEVSYEPTLFDFNLVKPVALVELGRILSALRQR